MANPQARLWRRELAHERDGELNYPQTGSPERRVTEYWNLICLTTQADMSEDLASALFPDIAPGTYRPNGYYVERLKIQKLDNSEHCQAVVELTLTVGSGRNTVNDPNPLRRPLRFEVDTDFEEVPAEVDGEGNPLVNTASEPLLGIVREEQILVFSGTRYITQIPQWLGQFAHVCVNSEPIDLDGFIAEPETLKMKGVKLSLPQYTEIDGREIEYREMPLQFFYRESTWRTEYLNQGLTEYFPAKPIYQPFYLAPIGEPPKILGYTQEIRRPAVDSTGKPVTKPVPLTKDGTQIRERINVAPPGSEPQFEWVLKQKLEKSDLHFVKYLIPRKLDFNLLFT
jgi:hypothetical protein